MKYNILEITSHSADRFNLRRSEPRPRQAAHQEKLFSIQNVLYSYAP
jgi:hypothetical protein